VEIDNEFRNYIRPLSSEEYDKLEASILSEGIRDPLVIWQGILLDGYHRYKIAQEHGLEYKTVEVELPDRDAAKEWILVNQLGRRNLTEQEASYYRGKLYSAKKQQGKRTDLTLAQNVLKSDTAEELGKQYGVSQRIR
jgi:ParB-like chromosome segregation protein Spo0J